MSKQRNTTPGSAIQPKAPGTEHQWEGEAVERESRTEETPELAASRAEGNAPMSVQAARAREAAASDPGTFGLSGGAQSTANDDTAEDDAENTEEKRRAAAEEHADASSKRFPHGRL